MTIPVTLPPAYFDAMYQGAADPWGFQDRWYEQRKYAVSLALLPAVRYRSALRTRLLHQGGPWCRSPSQSTARC